MLTNRHVGDIFSVRIGNVTEIASAIIIRVTVLTNGKNVLTVGIGFAAFIAYIVIIHIATTARFDYVLSVRIRSGTFIAKRIVVDVPMLTNGCACAAGHTASGHGKAHGEAQKR
jgi:hypothetical protein